MAQEAVNNCLTYAHIIGIYSGTPWQCRLRRRHFREWEVVERVELKIDGIIRWKYMYI